MSDLFMSAHDPAQRRWHRSTAPGSAASFTGSCAGSGSGSGAAHATAGAQRDRMGRNKSSMPNGGGYEHSNGNGSGSGDASGRDFENLLSLQLRKPKNWKWELTTSRSCTNIALPRILLYNHKGELLVDAAGERELCIRQDDVVPPTRRSRSDTRSSEKPCGASRDGSTSLLAYPKQRSGRAATADLTHSIRRALDRQLSGLQIQEATPSNSSMRSGSAQTMLTLNSPIDFYTNDLPDYASLGRRSNSLKGVRFRVAGNGEERARMRATPKGSPQPCGFPIVDLPTPPSTATPTTTTTASSSSGTREKRRYRRSHSSGRSPTSGRNSRSILERMSYSRGRYSSPETELAETHEVAKAPRYFLRSSKAGTLMLREESFTQYRRRRRKPKTSSSETLPSEDAHLRGRTSSSHLRLPDVAALNGREGGSLQDISELPECQHYKPKPIRRFRSDGNVLLQKPTPSSSEVEGGEDAPYSGFHTFRTSSKRGEYRRRF